MHRVAELVRWLPAAAVVSLGALATHATLAQSVAPSVNHETETENVEKSRFLRIVRDDDGDLTGIVEHNECDETQRRIREVNPSYYCFDAQLLFKTLHRV